MERFGINSNRHRFPESHADAGQKKLAMEEMWKCLQHLKELGHAVENKEMVNEISLSVSKVLAQLESINIPENGVKLEMTASGPLSHHVEKSRCKKKRGNFGRRKNTVSKHIVEDYQYSWRKYGQRFILGAMHPRCYYRCTFKNSKGCPARRQVQKSDRDESIYDITYIDDHTCRDSPESPEVASCLNISKIDSSPHSSVASSSNSPMKQLDEYWNTLTTGFDPSFLSDIVVSPPATAGLSEHREWSFGFVQPEFSLEDFNSMQVDPYTNNDVFFN